MSVTVSWIDKIEDFRFDVTHLPCLRNPTDPLSRSCFEDGNGTVPSKEDPYLESQQELFSRLGRDTQCPAGLAAGWAEIRQVAAVAFASVQEGDKIPSTRPRGGAVSPPCTSMFVALAGSELALGTGTTPAPPPPAPSANHFLAPAFIQTLVQELAVDAFFGPIMQGAVATLGRPVDRHGTAVLKASRALPSGIFLMLCSLLYQRGQGEADRLCIPAGGCVRAQVFRECHDGPLGGHFCRAKTGLLVRSLAFWVGQDRDVAEYVCTCQTCQQTNLKAEHR
jgi:hypothetical protein